MLAFLKKTFTKKKNGFFFIHIPKTAGTSFINILDSTTHLNKIFPCQLWKEVNEEMVKDTTQYDLLRGHFGGGSYKLLSRPNLHKLTILRHPKSLSISTFHFIKREKNTAVHDLVKDKKMDLKAFLEEPLTAQKINNRMVRHLSFDLQKDPSAQELFLSRQSVKVVSKWIKAPKRITNKQRLIRAQKALDECSWFGLQERFDESMQLFAYTFNLPPIGKSARLNTHKPDQNIDSHCDTLINKQNHYDLKLYAYAEKQFETNYQNMLADLKNSCHAACQECSVDDLLDKHYQSTNTITRKNAIDFDFSQGMYGSGWHRRELTQPDNSYFRWTSHNSAYLDFWVVPQNYQMTIRIINVVSIDYLNTLDICINGTSIPYEYDINEGVVRLLNATIDQSLIKNGLLRIQFNHPETKIHDDIFNSDDQRSLGIAVNWIKLKSI